MWAISTTFWNFPLFFPCETGRRKAREISKCCRNCSQGSYSYFTFPLVHKVVSYICPLHCIELFSSYPDYRRLINYIKTWSNWYCLYRVLDEINQTYLSTKKSIISWSIAFCPNLYFLPIYFSLILQQNFIIKRILKMNTLL